MGINGPLFYYFLPVFVVMIGWEVWEGRRRGLKLYTRGETISSIVIGIGQRFIGLIPLSIAGFVGTLAYQNRFFTVPLNAWQSWLVLFVLLEFTYYWFHRLSHEVRWFWTTHAVHHSIEELNILASYRLGWTSKLSAGSITHTPLMLIGFSPESVFTMLALNLFYQSWLHTVLIGKLGPLEGILNTPSAHRVHHARNADYLDRNYGGVTVIFDRLFGTYVAERKEDPCEYGLIKPVGSNNPLAIVFHEWGRMLADVKRSHPRHWLGYMFGQPGWAPHGKSVTSDDIRARYRANKGKSAVVPPANATTAQA
jgi:sterol desaturase/sphingolipid hydroxylase (fatty acid hydroxylase superfamily)